MVTIDRDQLAEKLEQGGVIARLVIELMGKPKEHIEETLSGMIDRLKEEGGCHVLKEEIFEAELQDETQMFSAFVNVEVLVNDLSKLSSLCFYYLPSSVEIVEPSELTMHMSLVNDLFNDLMGKVHQLDLATKNLRMENESHKLNMGKLLKSSMRAICLNPHTASEVANILHIEAEQAEVILDHMVQKDTLEKSGSKYQVK